MSRPLKKLARKYGKLTVVGEQTTGGRRYATVTCTCGQQKEVLVDALTSGRTKSCGAAACKYGRTKVRKVRTSVPRGCRTIPKQTLFRIWQATTRAKDPMTIAEAAAMHKIEKVQTLYSALRVIRECGGWAKYSEIVK